MNLYQFNNIIYKGNVNRDFYFYCLKSDIRLIKYLFLNMLYLLISVFSIKRKSIFEERKFNYLKEVKELDKKVKIFYKDKERFNNYLKDKVDVIVDRVPKIFIDKKICSKIVGYELDSNFNVNIKKYNDEKNKLKNITYLYIRNKYELKEIGCNNIVYVRNNHVKYSYNKTRKYLDQRLFKLISIFLISLFLTMVSFCYTNYNLNITMYKSYFEPLLFVLNFLPIFVIILFLSFVFKRIDVPFLITSIFVLALGIANQTKLLYRDDIVKFEDLTLLKESFIMSQKYDIVIKKYTVIFIFLILILFFLLKRYISKYKINLKKQIITLIIISVFSVFIYNALYQNVKIYDKIGDTSEINIWIGTRQYQIRGLIYPFVYTSSEIIDTPPEGYDKEKAKEILNEYTYEDIPESSKVNVIAIMLEAFNDFSKFDSLEFNEDIYAPLHEIQDKSLHGNLLTTIFGGGTVVTERNFLTGYYDSPSYRKNTNSYVWYFKEQGYRTEAMHPIYGAFYNRASVNPNLGFDAYYYYENRYSKVQSEFMKDDEFFDDIISGYEKAIKDGVPYFNFSVTYQNHGPYSSETYDIKEYLIENKGYSDSTYNTVNEYFSGIKQTNIALKKLIDYFENELEPTIVIFFGDHNPYLGDNGYEELGINLSLDTVEGFENYYETPYVIYANKGAKEMFNKDFIGEINTISPIFLMNEFFDYVGLKGNQYLQYMSNLKQTIDVISPYYYKKDQEFVLTSDSKCSSLIGEYNKINYYYSRNFFRRKND